MGLTLSKTSGAKGYFSMTKGTPLDSDAQAFINATGITGTNATAVNKLVLDLKAASIWTKMKGIWPMVGGTATTHMYNLKDPQNTNTAYRLGFVGGWTHSSTGAKPNGIDAYANTYIAANVIAQNSGHMTYYSRTDSASTGLYCMGYTISSLAMQSTIQPRFNSTTQYGFMAAGTGAGTQSSVTVSSSTGFLGVTRTGSTSSKTFKNSALGLNAGGSSVAPNGTLNFLIGAMNHPTFIQYAPYECAFSSIGDGLTDAEIPLFYTAVQTYQTTLGRQV